MSHVSGCPCNGFGGEYAKCECEHWRQIHAMNAHTSALEAHARQMQEEQNKDERIDELTRENADLRARLAAAKKDRDNALDDNTGLALKCATLAEELDNFKALASRETARRLEAEKARDEQAEAVRVLAKEILWYAECADDLHTCHVGKLPCETCKNIKRLNAATRETQNNHIAAAAVKEASE